MNKLNYNRVFWTIGFFLLTIVVIAAVRKKKGSEISEIVVSIKAMSNGYNLLHKEDVEKVLHKGFGFAMRGIPFEDLDVLRVEKVLEDDPFIASAEASVDGKNALQLRIVQREPALRIIDATNANYYLDKEGIRMPLSKHFTARVLVATGNIPPWSPDFKVRKKYLLKDLYTLALKIQENEFLNALCEQIYVNSTGEFVLVPKVGNQKILLGNYDNIDDKLYRLEQFYINAMPYVGWNKYALINLKYKNQIVCKKR